MGPVELVLQTLDVALATPIHLTLTEYKILSLESVRRRPALQNRPDQS
jgi:hypothetical protein